MKLNRAVLTLPATLALSWTAQAGIVTVSNPGGSFSDAASIRWGANGFEAGILAPGATANINPVGTPFWALNQAYNFQFTYDAATGTVGLNLDVNHNGTFDSGETLTKVAAAWVGQSFNNFSIYGNEGGSTGRATLSSLVVNGVPVSDITPGGVFLQTFYRDSDGNPLSVVDVTGSVTFTAAGTAQERPTFHFQLGGNALAVVPEPTTMIAGVLCLVPLGAGALSRLRNVRGT